MANKRLSDLVNEDDKLRKMNQHKMATKAKPVIDLALIGEKVAEFITKKMKHQVKPEDIYVLLISSHADAIAICRQQFNYYNKRKQPDRVPCYFLNGGDLSVVKLGNTMAGLDNVVQAFRKKGIVFEPAREVLQKQINAGQTASKMKKPVRK